MKVQPSSKAAKSLFVGSTRNLPEHDPTFDPLNSPDVQTETSLHVYQVE